MTFDEYINNPMGFKNAVISHREMFRAIYMSKLDKILVREAGKINYKLYKSANIYYIHIKIPSEVISNFYYDVVIEFYTDKNELRLSRSLSEYYVNFYSNDPSFVYTFAYAMLDNDLFVKDLIPKMSKEAVKNIAKVKNPKKQIGYVKSLYFTYLLCRRGGLFNKIKFEAEAQPYNSKWLLSQVEHATIKIEQREEAQKKYNEQNKKKTTTNKELQRIDTNNIDNSLATRNTKIISNTGIIKPVINNINKTNRVGNSKVIKPTKSNRLF
jgi:hypothetical protein